MRVSGIFPVSRVLLSTNYDFSFSHFRLRYAEGTQLKFRLQRVEITSVLPGHFGNLTFAYAQYNGLAVP